MDRKAIKRFKDKVAIVTAAGQGIGEHYAKALAAEGAAVRIAEINLDNAPRVADDIAASGGRAIALRTDVSSEASCAECVEETVKAFGGLDFLINNAAIFAGMRRESWMEIDLDYYHRFMAVNFESVYLMTRAAYPALKARGGGVIINQSSAAAWYGGNYYGLAKLGVNGLTIALAKELGPQGIRMNAAGISSGWLIRDGARAKIGSRFCAKNHAITRNESARPASDLTPRALVMWFRRHLPRRTAERLQGRCGYAPNFKSGCDSPRLHSDHCSAHRTRYWPPDIVWRLTTSSGSIRRPTWRASRCGSRR